jgi:cytoskeletal protein RodZ
LTKSSKKGDVAENEKEKLFQKKRKENGKESWHIVCVAPGLIKFNNHTLAPPIHRKNATLIGTVKTTTN